MVLALLSTSGWTYGRYLFLLMIVYFLGVVLIGPIRDRWNRYGTRSWPITTATVASVTSKLGEDVHGGYHTDVTVHYVYMVPAAQKGFYEVRKASRLSADALQALEGRGFPIRYNPQNHGESVVLQADRPY